MDKKFLSVIIPVYNGEKTIEKALYSVYKQIEYVKEIIVCNDNSTDNTIECVEELKEEFNLPVKIAATAGRYNQGPGIAKNAGLEIVAAPYLTFLDADDTIEIGAFEKVYDYICAHPQEKVIRGHFLYETLDKIQFPVSAPISWTHGKYYKTNFIKEENIKFFNYRANEDIFFNNCVNFALLKYDIDLTKKPIEIPHILYNWKECENSITFLDKERKFSEKYFYCMIHAYVDSVMLYQDSVKNNFDIRKRTIEFIEKTYNMYFSQYKGSKEDAVFERNYDSLIKLDKVLKLFDISDEEISKDFYSKNLVQLAYFRLKQKKNYSFDEEVISFEKFLAKIRHIDF